MMAISKIQRGVCAVNSLLAGHNADRSVPTVLVDGIDIGAGFEGVCEGLIIARQGS